MSMEQQEHIIRLEAELFLAKQRIEELEKENDLRGHSIDSLLMEVENLKRDYKESDERVAELEKLKNKVLEENHALTEKNDDLQERVVNLSADIEKYLDLPIGPDVAGRQILHEAVGRPWP